jgi:uncharacterized protein
MKCIKCGNDNLPDAFYCIECGNQIKGEKIDNEDLNKKHFVRSIILFLCLVIIIVFSIRFADIPFLNHEYIFSGLLVLITLVFVFLDFKAFIKLFRFSWRLKPLLQIIIGAPILATLVVFLANNINNFTGYTHERIYVGYLLNTSNVFFWGLLFVSIIPGFFEEFLFRGVLFNHLLKLTNPKATILISGILFAFIHFSFLSLLWLGFIGIYLGYLRFRYRTIWYGIFFHAFYNAFIFLLEMYLDK